MRKPAPAGGQKLPSPKAAPAKTLGAAAPAPRPAADKAAPLLTQQASVRAAPKPAADDGDWETF